MAEKERIVPAGLPDTQEAGLALSPETIGSTTDSGERECLVVLNGGAGALKSDPKAGEGIEEAFRAHGLRAQVKVTQSGEDIERFVGEALKNNIGMVVVGGGDGTVSSVAAKLLDTDTTLAVLPLGTLNHFAKDLGIPLERDEAIAANATGNEALVDVGEVNGRTFINNSSLGLYPLAVHMREEEQKRGASKWIAFAKAGVKVLGRYPLLNVKMSVKGKEIVIRTPIVFIGNNCYELEGLAMSTRKRLDAGVLSVCVTRDVGRIGLIALLIRALFGRLRNARDLSVFECESLSINTRHRNLRVATDGEVNEIETPLEYRTRKKALRVIAPSNNTHANEVVE